MMVRGCFWGSKKRRLIGEALRRQMGWVAGSKRWLAEEDSKRKTGERRKKKEEDRERGVFRKREDVRVGVFFWDLEEKEGED